MKRFLLAVAAALFLLPSAASAQELWRMDAFRADVAVRADGVVEVRETVSADFLSDRRGIFRYVPVSGEDDQGRAYRLDVDLMSVTRDGASERVESSREGGNLVWKIGRAEVTLRGKHEYVLVYEVRGAIGRFEEHDELYWNVTGFGWDVPLPAAVATVSMPAGVASTGTVCYTGAYGSTESDCAIEESSGRAVFTAATGEPLTIAIKWPKGAVKTPASEILRAGFGRLASAANVVVPVALPALVFFLMYRHWKKHGDDPEIGAIVTQYGPPEDFGPAETVAIIAQSASNDLLAPTVIDLAARGYLRLTELPEKDYLLESLQPRETWKALKPFESELLDRIFPGETIVSRKLSELKDRFYPSVMAFRNGVMDRLIANGHFPSHPGTASVGWCALGLLLVFPGFALAMVAGFGFMIATVLSGIIVGAFGAKMGRRTEKGSAAYAHALGFKEFISKVEKYRAPWMEERGVIERLLPYAISFGLGQKWVETFSSLMQQPPEWYRGATMGAWSSDAFSRDIVRFGKSFTSVALSQPAPPPGSRSAFGGGGGGGGGGFSGGGRGGGGGGSW